MPPWATRVQWPAPPDGSRSTTPALGGVSVHWNSGLARGSLNGVGPAIHQRQRGGSDRVAERVALQRDDLARRLKGQDVRGVARCDSVWVRAPCVTLIRR
ncbi:MAG: hypothetical protein AUH08_09670 [Verrucomicrobia bacterium 13_2_20CM_54_12]|nr:MAG: hypothetical protein AUH08_09670 [Verrucomicrobia bacterium 13_2_20CM_54_12]